MRKSNRCTACNIGIIKWDQKEVAYRCDNCYFEVPFGINQRLPTYFVRGKHFLGGFIGHDPHETELERRLRVLHKNIGTVEELKRRKEHFEARVDKNRARILRYWRNHLPKKANCIDKAETVLNIIQEYHIPKSVVCEVLWREKKWAGASFGVWYYNLAQRYSNKVNKLWSQLNGDKIIKRGFAAEQASLVQVIANVIRLDPYPTAKILEYSNIWNGGGWALWTFEQIKNYGRMVGQLWGNRKDRVDSDWSLCETVEDMSKDIGKDWLSPYVILQILANQKAVDLDPNAAFTTYSTYKNAKSALKIIKKEGPKTKKGISGELGISWRVASYSLNLLQEQGFVNAHQDKRCEHYFYTPNQESLLKDIALYSHLEDQLLSSGRAFITSPEIEDQNIPNTTARRLLGRWVSEGKLVEISGKVKPKMYAVIHDGLAPKEAIRNTLTLKFKDILKSIKPEGVTKYRIASSLYKSSAYKYVKIRLDLLEEHGLVRKDGNRYFPGETF